MKRPQFDSWVRKIPWKRDNLHTPVLWASLVSQMVKNPPAMPETWIQFLCWEDALEEGMATHSGVLVWRILMDRGAWWATVLGGCKESDMME